MGFEKFNHWLPIFTKINKDLVKGRNNLYCFRGNHDDPAYFNGENASKMNDIFSNITFLSDYSVLEHKDRKMIVIGGGISIDRLRRYTMKDTYWPSEVITFTDEQKEFVKSLSGITTILSHMAPKSFWPWTKDSIVEWARHDHTVLHEDSLQRLLLEDIERELQINSNVSEWYYGHYHESYKTDYENIKVGECVAMNKMVELN